MTESCYCCGDIITEPSDQTVTACCGQALICSACASQIATSDSTLKCCCGHNVIMPVTSLDLTQLSNSATSLTLTAIFQLRDRITSILETLNGLTKTIATWIEPPLVPGVASLEEQVTQALQKYSEAVTEAPEGFLKPDHIQQRCDYLVAEYRRHQHSLSKSWQLDLTRVLAYLELYDYAATKYQAITSLNLAQAIIALQQWYQTYHSTLPDQEVSKLQFYFSGRQVRYNICFYEELGPIPLDQLGQIKLECSDRIQLRQAEELLTKSTDGVTIRDCYNTINTINSTAQLNDYHDNLIVRCNARFRDGAIADIYYHNKVPTTQYYLASWLIKAKSQPDTLYQTKVLFTTWLSPSYDSDDDKIDTDNNTTGHYYRYLTWQLYSDQAWNLNQEDYCNDFDSYSYLLIQRTPSRYFSDCGHDCGHDQGQLKSQLPLPNPRDHLITLYQNQEYYLQHEPSRYFDFNRELVRRRE